MRPAITVITLGVDDLDASLRFYRDGLGFPTDGIVGTEFEQGAVVFIPLQAGVRLALAAPNPANMTLGHNVATTAEVDAVMARARAAGAVIVKAAHDTFWGGYSGYFQDPDGHLWEVVWNPQWSA